MFTINRTAVEGIEITKNKKRTSLILKLIKISN